MEISWNNEKDEAKQRQFPGLSFELVATEILEGRFTYGFKKSNKSEKVIIVELPWNGERKYPIQVAFVIDKELSESGEIRIFLKTFFPNRYLK